MEAEALLPFQLLHPQSRLLAEGADLVQRVRLHVSVADQICQRQLHVIDEPHDSPRPGVVAEDQPAVRLQYAGDLVEKRLRIWIVVEALGVDDQIKAPVRKGHGLAVSDHEFRVRKLLLLCLANHLRRQIQTDEGGLRIGLGQERYHRRGAAACVQQGLKGLGPDLRKNRRIVLAAHFVDPGLPGFVVFRGLRKLADGELLVGFCASCHSVCLLSSLLCRSRPGRHGGPKRTRWLNAANLRSDYTSLR